MSPRPALLFVDDHLVKIAADRGAVWRSLERYVGSSLRLEGPLGRLLGAEPPSGFAIAEATPEKRMRVVGRHRFSSYDLRFELSDAGGGATTLRALTYAAFPGPLGRLYRAAVIGTGAHALVTKRMLQTVRRRSPSGD